MERGQLSRPAFMEQIRGLTTDIVSKVRGGMGTVVEGHFHDLEVPCPKCGSERFKESFKAYECANPECKLLIWKSMAGRELERPRLSSQCLIMYVMLSIL